MIKTILWVVGEPGVGKTTFVRAMLGDVWEFVADDKGAKWTVAHGGRVVAAGHYHGRAFDGGDTISYSGGQATLNYWRDSLSHEAELTICDGDRLSNDKAIEYFVQCRTPSTWIRTICCMLVASEDVTKARRDARGDQNASWVKGRKTKSENFFKKFGHDNILVDTNCSIEELQQSARNVMGTLLAIPHGRGVFP